MRIPSGKIDQNLYFHAESTTGGAKTGLASFTVYRSRNGGTATIYTTPTVTEISTANMPGLYSLLIDEDTTIASASDSEEYALYITATGMIPVWTEVELYRRDTTTGQQALVDASGRVDVIKIAGTTQTARDIGASVLLSTGTGTGQLDFTSGVVKASLAQILGTALTETAGQIAAGFKKVFDVAVPVFTAASVNQTGDAYGRLGAPAGASVSADIAAAKVDTAAIKVQTDKLTFTVTNQVDSNVLDWKSATAPAMTGDAFARLGAPAGASVSADVAAVKVDTAAIKTKTDSLTFTGAGKVDASVRDWIGGTIPAVNVTGVPLVDLKYTLGTISPATAGSVRADAVTGAVGSVTGAVGSVTGAVGSVTGLTASNLDATVSSRLASASYTAPDNTSVTAIKTQTDKLTFTVTNKIDANVKSVNNVTVSGVGTAGSPWGP